MEIPCQASKSRQNASWDGSCHETIAYWTRPNSANTYVEAVKQSKLRPSQLNLLPLSNEVPSIVKFSCLCVEFFLLSANVHPIAPRIVSCFQLEGRVFDAYGKPEVPTLCSLLHFFLWRIHAFFKLSNQLSSSIMVQQGYRLINTSWACWCSLIFSQVSLPSVRKAPSLGLDGERSTSNPVQNKI